jgi:hypothetical protein
VKYPAADITSAVPFRFLAFTGYGNHSLYVADANISVRGKDKDQEPVEAGTEWYSRRGIFGRPKKQGSLRMTGRAFSLAGSRVRGA